MPGPPACHQGGRRADVYGSLTRLLVPRSAVSVLNCSQNFPLTFADIKGMMIATNPRVKVNVELSEYHSQDYHSHNHTELFEVKSLLYTPEEIHNYEQMLPGAK